MGLESSKKKKGAPEKKAPTPMEVKTYIMVAQTKLTLYRNKKVALIKNKRREVVNSLKENNLDVAKAKMDSIIREEDLITVFDILGPLCEILKEKVTYIMSSAQCPSDVRAPLDTLIYASYRLEVEELHRLRELIGMKYGELYINKGNSNADGLVNVNLIEKLKIKPASEAFITIRLKQLCKEENFEFEFPCEIIGGNEFTSSDQMGMGGGMSNQLYQPGNQGNPYGSQFGLNDYQQGGWNPNNQQYDLGQNQNPYGNPSQPQNPYGSNPSQPQNPYGGNPSMMKPNQSQQQNPYGGNPSMMKPNQSQQQNPYGGNTSMMKPNQSQQQNPYGGNPSIKQNPNDYSQGGFNDYNKQFDNPSSNQSNFNPNENMNFNPNQYNEYNPNPYQSQVKPQQSQIKPVQSQYQQPPQQQPSQQQQQSNLNPYGGQEDYPRASQIKPNQSQFNPNNNPYSNFNASSNPSGINPSQIGKPGKNDPKQQSNSSYFSNQSMNLPGGDQIISNDGMGANFNPYTINDPLPQQLQPQDLGNNSISVSQKKYVNAPMEGFNDDELPSVDQQMKNESQHIDNMFPSHPK